MLHRYHLYPFHKLSTIIEDFTADCDTLSQVILLVNDTTPSGEVG